MQIRILILALLAAASFGPSAHGACVIDDASLKSLSRMVAASRACPNMSALPEEALPEIAIAMGAIDKTDGKASWCRADYMWRITTEWLKWSEFQPKQLRETCQLMETALRGDPKSLEFAIAVGILKR